MVRPFGPRELACEDRRQDVQIILGRLNTGLQLQSRGEGQMRLGAPCSWTTARVQNWVRRQELEPFGHHTDNSSILPVRRTNARTLRSPPKRGSTAVNKGQAARGGGGSSAIGEPGAECGPDGEHRPQRRIKRGGPAALATGASSGSTARLPPCTKVPTNSNARLRYGWRSSSERARPAHLRVRRAEPPRTLGGSEYEALARVRSSGC